MPSQDVLMVVMVAVVGVVMSTADESVFVD